MKHTIRLRIISILVILSLVCSVPMSIEAAVTNNGATVRTSVGDRVETNGSIVFNGVGFLLTMEKMENTKYKGRGDEL